MVEERRLRRVLSSIRLRIVVGYVALVAVALTIATVVTRQVQLTRADREFEREQAQEVAELRRFVEQGVDPETGRPFGTDVRSLFRTFLERSVPADDEAFYTLVDGAGFLASFGAPPLADDERFLTEWDVDEPTAETLDSGIDELGEVRYLAVPLVHDGEVLGVFVVASFTADDYREVREVVLVIVIAGAVVLLVTSLLAWSTAGRVLRPVRDLTATARQISESDLSARIPVDGHDELAELGRTFNDMVDRLERGFAMQRQFLDDVAHELRTPITIARGHLEVLGDDPAERAETIEIVTDELDRMSRYVSDLLVLAKAEQPDFLVPEPIDVGELVLDLHHRVRAIGERNWVLDQAPDIGAQTVVADRGRIVQAIVNLATNAVQHTDVGDEIGIGGDTTADAVRLWVRDTGPGIDPEIAATLFDRTARGAHSRSRRPEGTGIGLSIVDAIVRAHGGVVAIDRTAAGGATFTITLPRSRPLSLIHI